METPEETTRRVARIDELMQDFRRKHDRLVAAGQQWEEQLRARRRITWRDVWRALWGG